MPHPLAAHLAPIIDQELSELRLIVARFVASESDPEERQRLRLFGARLGAFKTELARHSRVPSSEEMELALTVLLVTQVGLPEASPVRPEQEDS